MSKKNFIIPEEFRITKTIEQIHYLVDGELKEWKGKTTSNLFD